MVTLAAARKLAAGLMEYRTQHLFSGGNDGWPAWATADTRARYGALIVSDTNRYAPTGYAANPQSADGKYSLDELFQIVLTQSYFAPIDSTSNHILMNATARFLAEMVYPGQVVKGYNNSVTDPTGANTIINIANSLTAGGPGEYGSPNYGADNWGEFLSLSQLANPSTALYAKVQQEAAAAYGCALVQIGAFWMNGNLAMSTGRGYPSTGAWGVAAGDVLSWVYFASGEQPLHRPERGGGRELPLPRGRSFGRRAERLLQPGGGQLWSQSQQPLSLPELARYQVGCPCAIPPCVAKPARKNLPPSKITGFAIMVQLWPLDYRHYHADFLCRQFDRLGEKSVFPGFVRAVKFPLASMTTGASS
jgi:hypothetical protein